MDESLASLDTHRYTIAVIDHKNPSIALYIGAKFRMLLHKGNISRERSERIQFALLLGEGGGITSTVFVEGTDRNEGTAVGVALGF